MIKQPVYIYGMLMISMSFTAFSTSAAGVTVTSPQSGNVFTRALLPGFTRSSLQSRMSAIAESSRRSDPRFSLKPVAEHAGGSDAIAEPVVVDNLLRFRF
jgi:hypothetical protein